MRSSRRSFITKQPMKICRSVTIQDASSKNEDNRHKINDRASSTTNMYSIEW
jgi:hypothetical protein